MAGSGVRSAFEGVAAGPLWRQLPAGASQLPCAARLVRQQAQRREGHDGGKQEHRADPQVTGTGTVTARIGDGGGP